MAASVNLPEHLLAEVQAVALTEHRSVDEVLEDAVKKYLDERSWMNLIRYGRERAIATGYEGDEGADRAIAEYRAEKRSR
jgi:metal-responsive CopG/Arc/MetJ family transcriptional regulator